MGYYDFDNHFWSPEEVCGQPFAQKILREKKSFKIKRVVLALVIGIPLIAFSTWYVGLFSQLKQGYTQAHLTATTRAQATVSGG